MLSVAAGCMDGTGSVLVQLTEARRLAAELRVQFATAVEAANRAVMADTDEASGAAAREAQQATEAIEHDVQALHRLIDALGYTSDGQLLDEFNTRFAEYPRARRHHPAAGRGKHQSQGAAAVVRPGA